MHLVRDFGFWDFEGIRDKHLNYHSVFTISEESQHIDVEACSRDKSRQHIVCMVFKSFKVVTFEQVLGFDDGDSDCKYRNNDKRL